MDHLEINLNKEVIAGTGLIDLVFSWSVKDVLNAHLYRHQVIKIPETFPTVTSYLKSFIPSLCEETHADLLSNIMTISQAPTCEVPTDQISKNHKPSKGFFYDIVIKGNGDKAGNFVGTYEPQVGDLIALTDIRPKCIDHLNGPRNSYVIAYVLRSTDIKISIRSSKPISREGDMQISRSKRNTLFAVYLMNMTTNVRVWKALTANETSTNLISKVLQVQPGSSEGGNTCTICFSKKICSPDVSSTTWSTKCCDLNDSQKAAVSNSISLSKCDHQNTIKLIWGPPGTGKTKTVATSLYSLFKLKCRVLVCAPTNIAVLGVAERLLRLVNQSFDYGNYGLGDIVLFGNKERMKIENHDDLVDVFLDYRTEVLAKCFAPLSGWKHWLKSMISLLEDPALDYSLYVKERRKSYNEDKEKSVNLLTLMKNLVMWATKPAVISNANNDEEDDLLSFEDFFKKKFDLFEEKFDFLGENLLNCMVNLYTHLPTSCMPLEVVKNMVRASNVINSFKSLLHHLGFVNEQSQLLLKDCVHVLSSLRAFSVPNVYGMKEIGEYCLENACLIFCTVSSSSKLLTKKMTPLDILIIDEAAQLKECESAIPLQLPGLRHAILIGDDRQLPAMVKSKISEKAGFGRSLFKRLVLLGHEKLLLNVQYRMHPSISRFPNMEFYKNRILDGPNVIQRRSGICFLPGKVYGSYSFINIAHGKEESDHGQSQKNMVEVAVVYEIVSSLYREFTRTKKKVSVGVISPYKAQVQAIEKEVKKYSEVSGTDFSVSVRSVDGFQGGEEDVIIISTVRCNEKGSVGFLSNRERANVMLTRARHCLWILGSGSTLINSNSIWKKVIFDAKKRKCFYNADEDKSLAQAITASLLKLDQLPVLLNVDSFLFRNAKWKVCYTSEFLKSIQKIKDTEILEELVSLLALLANGWRQGEKDKEHICHGGTSAQWLQKYAVKRLLNLFWSVDILEESSYSLQVMKVWDLFPVADTPAIAKRVHMIFHTYTADKMNLCQLRRVDGDIVVPMTWPVDRTSSFETDPVELLAKPFSSLMITDLPETSSATTHSKSKRKGKKATRE